jgi:hypothetical protein
MSLSGFGSVILDLEHVRIAISLGAVAHCRGR